MDHLPECFAATNKPWACPVCDALRACEQRVREEYVDDRYGPAYRGALQDARDAVAALPNQYVMEPGHVALALAAIDALRAGDDLS